MNITSGKGVVISNDILSGYYSVRHTGLKGRLYQFSSESAPLSGFTSPYDAYLPNPSLTGGNRAIAAAEILKNGCPTRSDRTGALYFKNDIELIGACHGYGHDDLTYYFGYNFYNAFYPAGYIAPPFGEALSIFQANQKGYENLYNGACNNINITEYNELFGIVSKSASDSTVLSSTLPKSIFVPIYSPSEACPPEVASTSYFDEFQFKHIAGSVQALGGNNFYNGNPIPTSLDNFDIKVNGRYVTETVGDDILVKYSSEKPILSYSYEDEENKLNTNLCQATLLETKVSPGRGTNASQLLEAPDAVYGGIGDQISFAGAQPFNAWHFTFKENAETLPFSNAFKAVATSPVTRLRRGSEGTQLFTPTLSAEESYWQNRQCPDTVDFLPHTFGASIYACPSTHFDVPYYSALRKFGFYGTRFLNSCKRLNLEYKSSEMPDYQPAALGYQEVEPDDLDAGGSVSFGAYNLLLKVAKAEENYSNMYALNKGFFLWANSGHIMSGQQYQYISSINPRFPYVFSHLIDKFENVFKSGLTSFTGSEPVVTRDLYNGDQLISSSGIPNILATNDEYEKFKKELGEVFTGNEMAPWNEIEEKYSYYVSDGNSIKEEFYKNVSSGKEKRIRTRYFENIVKGYPIDLFPTNDIIFSSDKAKDYLESPKWARRESTFGSSSELPEIERRYFEGAYGKRSAITGLVNVLNALVGVQLDYYYPGFFHDYKSNKMLPTPTYVPVVSGKIFDGAGRKFSPSGWLAIGYGEVGKYDNNFSCFTPIFVQQPLPTVFCKIGQQPTFRALAVDYHTIPEDKLKRRYPEIVYWASKLKLFDCKYNYLYPMKYKWYRVKKDVFDSSLSGASVYEDSQPAGHDQEWGCLEGDGPECTMFHPKNSSPFYTGAAARTEDDYTFLEGAVKGIDDEYYYYCSVSGRFGIRMSNKTELHIENWLRFDASIKNGVNAGGEVEVGFYINDFLGVDRKISFTSEIVNYDGYQQDLDSAAETVVEQKIPPPNAGFGDVRAFRFIGPLAYIGGTRTYTPSSLQDVRGLRETWGHFLDYGRLVSFEKELNQQEGAWLYGYKHLPTCENYGMANGKKGVRVEASIGGNKIAHWSLDQKAVASLDMKAGIQYDKLLNFGELYPPVNARFEGAPFFGVGHWQWGNNLGAIKRFGKESSKADIEFVGGGGGVSASSTKTLIEKVKKKLIGPSDLAGRNCGYSLYGLGRNMVYYIEAYERFYAICDPLKKKNVKNVSFMAPGIRRNNSAIQYFWLGRPHNTYVKRKKMYGPYAFQWKVNRHNRDRNGNGISEGFYSMGHGRSYSLLYDAPSIYGLYVKKDSGPQFTSMLKRVGETKALIKERYNLDEKTLRDIWWGEKGKEGGSRNYGEIPYTCDPTSPRYDAELCDYIGAAQALAGNLDFSDHVCPQDLLAAGGCFDPCLSMRYGQGFFPGGKLLDLFNNVGSTDVNDKSKKQIRIVATTKYKENGSLLFGDERAKEDKSLYFRSPLSTPHARVTLGLKKIEDLEDLELKMVPGVTPCQDGGSDHCNYNTPTIHIGVSSYLIGASSAYNNKKSYIANLYYSDHNIRGEVS